MTSSAQDQTASTADRVERRRNERMTYSRRKRGAGLLAVIVTAATLGLTAACSSSSHTSSEPGSSPALGAVRRIGSGTHLAAHTASATLSYQGHGGDGTIKGNANLINPTKQGPFQQTCQAGYYVRPAAVTNVAAQPQLVVRIDTDSDYLSLDITATNPYGAAPPKNSGARQLYQSFTYYVRSSTPYTHNYSVTWWCDKVPDWYQPTTSSVGEQPAPPYPNPSLDGFYTNQLMNQGPGALVMNNAGNTKTNGNPVVGWPDAPGQPNQNWFFTPLGHFANLPMVNLYSIWLRSTIVTDYVVTMDDTTAAHPLSIQYSAGGTPKYSSWYLVGGGAGVQPPPPNKADNAVMIVNRDEPLLCLTGPANAGEPIAGAPCDANNPAQYWAANYVK